MDSDASDNSATGSPMLVMEGSVIRAPIPQAEDSSNSDMPAGGVPMPLPRPIHVSEGPMSLPTGDMGGSDDSTGGLTILGEATLVPHGNPDAPGIHVLIAGNSPPPAEDCGCEDMNVPSNNSASSKPVLIAHASISASMPTADSEFGSAAPARPMMMATGSFTGPGDTEVQSIDDADASGSPMPFPVIVVDTGSGKTIMGTPMEPDADADDDDDAEADSSEQDDSSEPQVLVQLVPVDSSSGSPADQVPTQVIDDSDEDTDDASAQDPSTLPMGGIDPSTIETKDAGSGPPDGNDNETLYANSNPIPK